MRRSPPSSASPATSPSTPPAGGAPAARSKKSPTKSSASRTSCSAAPSPPSTAAIDDGRGGRIRTCKSFRTEHFKWPADPSFATPPLLVPARVIGGGGENRTHEYGFCRPAPYHLATPPHTEATTEDECWSGKRDSNPRPRPWQGRALPLSYSRLTVNEHRDSNTALGPAHLSRRLRGGRWRRPPAGPD